MSDCSTDEVSCAWGREWDGCGAAVVGLNCVTRLAGVIVCLGNLKHIMVWCILENCEFNSNHENQNHACLLHPHVNIQKYTLNSVEICGEI